jgi:alkylhydroperoxidase family enzyme
VTSRVVATTSARSSGAGKSGAASETGSGGSAGGSGSGGGSGDASSAASNVAAATSAVAAASLEPAAAPAPPAEDSREKELRKKQKLLAAIDALAEKPRSGLNAEQLAKLAKRQQTADDIARLLFEIDGIGAPAPATVSGAGGDTTS